MAIKISGTTVINDSRSLTNIASIDATTEAAIAAAGFGDITGVTAGSGLTGGGTSGTVTVSHADTSAQASVDNSGATVIQDVTLDTYGHVTGLGSKTLTATDVGALSTSGGTINGNITATSITLPESLTNGGDFTITKNDIADFFPFGNVDYDVTHYHTFKTNGTQALRIQNTLSTFAGQVRTYDGQGVSIGNYISEKVFSAGNGVSTYQINSLEYGILRLLPTQNLTLTELILDGTAVTIQIQPTVYSITWPTITWVNNGGLPPTLSSSVWTVVVVWSLYGTTYGAVVGQE